MDQKAWLWKKRSTEKTLVADRANKSSSNNEEEVTEVQKLLNEKTDLEKDLRILNEKLSSALSECNAKDNIAKKQVKIAEEAITGWEKAEIDAVSLKQELEKVLQQKAASDERVGHLEAALKECMQQLRFVREEQEKRVHDAVVNTAEKIEKAKIALDEKLVEAGKRLAKLDAENTQLSKALSGKDKVIEDLSKYKTQLEADFNALMLRVESTEKENASLKYEFRVLEKELDIRNEEREFNRRTAYVSQKQHQESVKRIAELETECQRLRLLVQKRLPGPAALAKMKTEVEMLRKDQVEMRRRKSNPSMTSSVECCIEVAPDAPSERVNFLTEQLCAMEEEHRALKDALNKKTNELQVSRAMYARVASRLSRAGGHIEESVKGQTTADPGKYLCFLREHSLAASSDVGSDDKASCAESWASALISELEHFKNEKQLATSSHRNMGNSDMNLMDDFAEMEKLAVVSVDYPAESSHRSSEEDNAIMGASGSPSGPLFSGHEIWSEYIAANKVPEWLGAMLKMLLEHSHVSQRSPQELLEDIRVTLAHNSAYTTVYGKRSSNHPDPSYSGSGHVFHTFPDNSLNMDVSDTKKGYNFSDTDKSGPKFRSNVLTSIQKVLELLEGINIQSLDSGSSESLPGKDDKLLSHKNLENSTGYMVRVFQWKTAELSAILQQFVGTCNDLLNGTTDLEQFAQQVASNLEWIMNHCFSLQDVSSMKDAIRNHLDWDDLESESEIDCGQTNHSVECNCRNSSYQMESLWPPIKEEDKTRNAEQENKKSSIVDLEERLQSEIVKTECFRSQLQESKDIIDNLHSEMETMKQSRGGTGSQVEKQKMMKEDLETQLVESNHLWRKACQRISHLENELENKNHSFKRLEETCHDLKIQLKSLTSKEVTGNGKHRPNQLENDLEITAASEKLAECQETILNLGKQLKALASPSEAALFDAISTPADIAVTSLSFPRKNLSQRSSLRDQMLAEDKDQLGASPQAKKDVQNINSHSAVSTTTAAKEYPDKFTNANIGINHEDKSKTAAASMDIVPCKKKGGRSFFKKLFWRRKKGNNYKKPSS